MASNMSGKKKRTKIAVLRRRDGEQCHYCRILLCFNNPHNSKLKPYSMTFDHVVPQVVGGTNENTNLVLCCNNCNNKLDDAYVKCECLFCKTAREIHRARTLDTVSV